MEKVAYFVITCKRCYRGKQEEGISAKGHPWKSISFVSEEGSSLKLGCIAPDGKKYDFAHLAPMHAYSVQLPVIVNNFGGLVIAGDPVIVDLETTPAAAPSK